MFLFTITSWKGQHELWFRKINSSGPANVSLSKPGQARRIACNDRSVTSDAVTLRTLVTLLCKKKAPLCGGEEQSIVGVCLGSWRGEAKFSLSSYGTSPNSHNVQWQEQVVIVSHSEKYSELQCDIVRDTRSFSNTSFMKPLPAFLAAELIRCMMIIPKQQLPRNVLDLFSDKRHLTILNVRI